MLIAKNIQWDIDLEKGKTHEEMKKEIGLPDEIEIPEEMTNIDDIEDYISDITGYCHSGFELTKTPQKCSMNKLEKLLKRAFENEGDKNSYKSGKYAVAFEERIFETLFWIYENNIPIMEGNIFTKEIQFNVSENEINFEYYISAIQNVLNGLLGGGFQFVGEIYEKYRKKQLENLPCISKTLADKLVKSSEINLKLFESHYAEINQMPFSELKEFVTKHSESIMGIGRDDVINDLSIDFRINSVLSASIHQKMDDNTVYIGDSFGIWDERGKHLGFFKMDEIHYMIDRTYDDFFESAASIEYNGIVFNNWTFNKFVGLIYGEMCESCAKKYREILEDELSPCRTGTCSVKNCDADTNNHYYVTFKPELIRIHERKEWIVNE